MTHSSRLLPVRRRGVPAMLKLPMEAEEKRGSLLMPWWDGKGAARVLAHDRDALLLERAMGTGSLAAYRPHGPRRRGDAHSVCRNRNAAHP